MSSRVGAVDDDPCDVGIVYFATMVNLPLSWSLEDTTTRGHLL
jgi:hypothetical protein